MELPLAFDFEHTVHYIYLIQEREFIKTSENIFKIGKTKQSNSKRFLSYPKGSIVLFQISCNNCDLLEKELLSSFKKLFIHRKDIGHEYFQGNHHQMIHQIYKYRIKFDDIFVKNYTKIKKDISTQTDSPSQKYLQIDFLPPGWEQKFDIFHSKFYYINHNDKTSTWDKPYVYQLI